MARWKLVEPHYLMVPEHYWEQMETDRDTGRQKRKQYPVPTHLNPKDPSDWTHKTGLDVTRGGGVHADGDIIVSWAEGYKYIREVEGTAEEDWPIYECKVAPTDRLDLIFEGPPTPGMEPIDDEATAIQAQFSWTDPQKDKYFGMTFAERVVFDAVTNRESNDVVAIQKLMAETLQALVASQAQTNALLAQLAGQRRV